MIFLQPLESLLGEGRTASDSSPMDEGLSLADEAGCRAWKVDSSADLMALLEILCAIHPKAVIAYRMPEAPMPLVAHEEIRLVARRESPIMTRTEWFTSGILNGVSTDGCPDTGSCINAISADYAKQQGWHFQPRSSLPGVKIPGNGFIRPIGTVTLPWQFKGETPQHKILFHVLPKSIHPVILGRIFLRATKCLDRKFAHRIQKKMTLCAQKNRLCFLGSRPGHTWGTLNGRRACALADTGSDVMIISRRFAKSLSLHVDTSPALFQLLEFADGSTRSTHGVVHDAVWSFGNGRSYKSNFLLLDGMDSDVILSNDFLFENQIFWDQDLYATSREAGPGSDTLSAQQLNLIKKASKRSRESTGGTSSSRPAATDTGLFLD